MSIRPYRSEDLDEVVDVWHRAGRAAYSYLSGWRSFTRDQAAVAFAADILPDNDVWVAVDDDGDDARIVGYLAQRGSYVDRLYVDPAAQRSGWGGRLLDHAHARFPDGLELCTHQENLPARILYEQRGFLAVRFGLSPEPECAPDVHYTWRPAPEGPTTVRPGTAADALFLPAVERSAATFYLPWAERLGLPRDVLACTFPVEAFRGAAEGGTLWVAVNPDGVPVGFALCLRDGDWAHIDELDVHPTYGRRGTGGALVRAACAGLFAQGAESVTLTTFRDTPWTVPFYERLGFTALDPERMPDRIAEVVRGERARGLRTDLRLAMEVRPGALRG